MSRKDELIKLAETFHAHAKQAQTGTAKWALEKMSDEYRQEAARLAGPDKPRIFRIAGVHPDTLRSPIRFGEWHAGQASFHFQTE